MPIHARAGPARSDGPRSLAGLGTRSDHRTARRATPELGTPLSASPCREHQQAAAPSWPGARHGESMPACALTRCRPGLTRPQRRGLPLATRAEGKRVSALSRPLDPPEPCCPPAPPTCSFTTSCACPRPMTARSSSPPRTWGPAVRAAQDLLDSARQARTGWLMRRARCGSDELFCIGGRGLGGAAAWVWEEWVTAALPGRAGLFDVGQLPRLVE